MLGRAAAWRKVLKSRSLGDKVLSSIFKMRKCQGDKIMGGVVKAVGSIIGGGSSPGAPAAPPAAPTATNDNTSAAVSQQAQGAPGRSADISAGGGPDLNASDDQYSVRKKLLGS